jgi:hypothetical protein
VDGLAGGRVCALSGTENRGHSELGSVVVAARNANVYRVFSGLAFGSGAAVGVIKRLFLAGFVRVLNRRFGLDHENGPGFTGVFAGV